MEVLLHLSFIVTIAHNLHAQTINDTDTLLSDLMTGYNKNIRPVESYADCLQVNVTFYQGGIQGFDELQGKLTFFGSILLNWIDIRMTWDVSLYNNSYVASVPVDWVWVPDLILGNSAQSVKTLSASKDWMTVLYLYNGLAFWSPSNVFEVSCSVDVKYYPFDTQYCYVMLISQRYQSTEQLLYAVTNKADKRYYFENGEWELVDSKIHTTTSVSSYQVMLILKRRPAFVIINVILPMLVLGILNMAVFIIPADCGERLSFAVTVLLAIAVFLTIISDNIPRTSAPLSVLSYFIGCQVLLSSLICLGVICNLHWFHKDNTIPIPSWVVYLMKKFQSNKIGPAVDIPNNKKFIASLVDVTKVTKINKNSEKALVKSEEEQYSHSTEVKSNTAITWKDVSFVADKIMFALALLWFLVMFIAFTFTMAFQETKEENFFFA